MSGSQDLPKENIIKFAYSRRGRVPAEHGPGFPVDIMSVLFMHMLSHPINVAAR